jgi:hypothetical protein
MASVQTSARNPSSMPSRQVRYHETTPARLSCWCVTAEATSSGTSHHRYAASTSDVLITLNPRPMIPNWDSAPAAGVRSVQSSGSARASRSSRCIPGRSSAPMVSLVEASRATRARCAPSMRARAR